MVQFKLDSERKTIEMEVMLKGEAEPLYVKIGRYAWVNEGNKAYIQMHDIRTSREWIDLVAREYVEGRRFEVPENIAKLAGVLI